MIKYIIRCEKFELTDAIKNAVETQIGKIEKYIKGEDIQAHVNLSLFHEKKAKVEVTIPVSHLTLRAEETSDDLYVGIEKVVKKLERQLRKYKTKINKKVNDKGLEIFDSENSEDYQEEFKAIRSKNFNLKPMNFQEAVLQMKMLGHDFFVYKDNDNGENKVIYIRNDKKIGLIELN